MLLTSNESAGQNTRYRKRMKVEADEDLLTAVTSFFRASTKCSMKVRQVISNFETTIKITYKYR